MKRRATYTVEVPIRFTYSADSDLDREQLLASAEKELEQRLINGYFDVLEKKLEIVDKVTHYTREEKLAQEKMWEDIIATINKPEPKPVNIFVKIFKGRKA
jgi:hypothetical protein